MIGRDKELAVVREHLRDGKNLIVFGPPGIGKTALIREAAPEVLYCADTGTLKSACESLLAQLGLSAPADNIARKRAILKALAKPNVVGAASPPRPVRLESSAGRGGDAAPTSPEIGTKRRWIIFDHVGWVSPKLESFLENIRDAHPMIVATRSLAWSELGHLRMILWDFDHLELKPLPRDAMQEILRAHAGNLAPSFERDVLRLSSLDIA